MGILNSNTTKGIITKQDSIPMSNRLNPQQNSFAGGSGGNNAANASGQNPSG